MPPGDALMQDGRRAARLAALRLAGPLVTAAGRQARQSQRARRPATHRASGAPRLLLIRPDHLGDVLLATPAAAVLRSALPAARIDWLVGPWSAEIARRAGGGDAVLTLDFPAFTRRPKSSVLEPYTLLLREARRLRAHRYDAALVLRPDHWWGAMLVALAGIPRRFGYAVAECQLFLTDTLPPPNGHVVAANQALARLAARSLGGDVASADITATQDLLAPRFPISPDDAAWAAAWEHERTGSGSGCPSLQGASSAKHSNGNGGAARPLIALHPGSGAPVKHWLPERWAEVVDALRRSAQAEVVLTGGPAERALVDGIAARLDPRPATLAGETTVGQLGALFARCALVIGGDSGPLHLAAAVGTPTVRLYGPTDPSEFGPWPPDGRHVVLAAGLSCQPCRDLIAPPCGATETPDCMRALDAGTVVRAARLALTPRGPRGEGTAPC